MNVERKYATGSGALNFAHALPLGSGECQQLLQVTLHLSSAPTTSENLTIAIDSGVGPEYDTLLYSVNPAATSLTDLLYQPSEPLYLFDGDALDVKWTNTDVRVYGLTVLLRAV